MTRAELGVKRDCPECGARFYDLNKEPAHCPKCDSEFVPEPLLKPRKPRPDDEAEAVKKPVDPTLSDADKEAKAAKSKRKPGLDEEASEEGEDELDIEIDDDDDDTLLEDDDEDEDAIGIVGGEDDDD